MKYLNKKYILFEIILKMNKFLFAVVIFSGILLAKASLLPLSQCDQDEDLKDTLGEYFFYRINNSNLK